MQITVNKKRYNFEKDVTLTFILNELKIADGNGFAVALNYSVIPKRKFEITHLKQGDVLEIIHATAGG